VLKLFDFLLRGPEELHQALATSALEVDGEARRGGAKPTLADSAALAEFRALVRLCRRRRGAGAGSFGLSAVGGALRCALRGTLPCPWEA
jgi:hypothetical protein